MHQAIAKALQEALGEIESLGDKAIRKHLMGLEDGSEEEVLEEEPAAVGITVEKVGKPTLEVVEGADGEAALDETEATPEEEEITGELLEKLKEALAR